jgi:cyclase
MAKETCTPVGNCQSFKGESAKYLPKKTFKEKMTLGTGKDRIDLYYFGPGHTDGDAIVVFPAVRVAHFADIFSRKTLPNIMPADGGSAVSLPQTLAKAVAGLKDVDRVISGHSHLFSWQELEEFAILQRDFLTMVQDAMRAGRTWTQ